MTEPWPWPADNALDKPRRVAWEYRRHLERLAPDLCAAVDQTMEAYGQRWVREQVQGVDLEAWLTDDVLADYLSVAPATIRKWWTKGLLTERRRDSVSLRWLYQYREALGVQSRARKRAA